MNRLIQNKYLLIGIPIIFLLSSLSHFIYDITGDNFIVGLFSPINESIFEHTKMVIIPIIFYFTIYYLLNKNQISPNAWFTATLISVVLCVMLIPLLYYFYTSAFGIKSLLVDIFILFLSILIAQLIAIYFYNNFNGIDYRLAIIFISLVIILFISFTLFAPRLPIFKEPINNTYGIYKIK